MRRRKRPWNPWRLYSTASRPTRTAARRHTHIKPWMRRAAHPSTGRLAPPLGAESAPVRIGLWARCPAPPALPPPPRTLPPPPRTLPPPPPPADPRALARARGVPATLLMPPSATVAPTPVAAVLLPGSLVRCEPPTDGRSSSAPLTSSRSPSSSPASPPAAPAPATVLSPSRVRRERRLVRRRRRRVDPRLLSPSSDVDVYESYDSDDSDVWRRYRDDRRRCRCDARRGRRASGPPADPRPRR